MGLTTLTVEVGNPARPAVSVPVRFLMDSGAIYSVVPARVLQGLRIRPIATETFQLADGSEVRRRKGGALFRYRDRVGVADVPGEEGDSTPPCWAPSR